MKNELPEICRSLLTDTGKKSCKAYANCCLTLRGCLALLWTFLISCLPNTPERQIYILSNKLKAVLEYKVFAEYWKALKPHKALTYGTVLKSKNFFSWMVYTIFFLSYLFMNVNLNNFIAFYLFLSNKWRFHPYTNGLSLGRLMIEITRV